MPSSAMRTSVAAVLCLLLAKGGTADEAARKKTNDLNLGTAGVWERLETLERTFEAEKRQRQKDAEEWQLSLRYLLDENRRLSEESEEWRTSFERLQNRAGRVENSLASLRQTVATSLQQTVATSLRQTVATWTAERATPASSETGGDPRPARPHAASAVTGRGEAGPDQRPLAARADDVDALEPVVAGLSQRLGEVGAEVAALQSSVSGQVAALKAANADQDLAIRAAATSTYVRWGRSVCPGAAQLAYAGVAGGGDSGRSGSPPTVLCLPLDPVPPSPAHPGHSGELWGAEYQTESGQQHTDKDPVCAVCRAPRPTVLTVPATTRCPAGWTAEYSGYLMGSYPGHSGNKDFVCMDSAFEGRLGSEADEGGLLLYYTKTHCGSLPCPPYEDGTIVSCVVCSK